MRTQEGHSHGPTLRAGAQPRLPSFRWRAQCCFDTTCIVLSRFMKYCIKQLASKCCRVAPCATGTCYSVLPAEPEPALDAILSEPRNYTRNIMHGHLAPGFPRRDEWLLQVVECSFLCPWYPHPVSASVLGIHGCSVGHNDG